MIKLIFSATLLFFVGVATAQTITFEQILPIPEFQDADVGDIQFADVDNDGDEDVLMTGKGGPVATTLFLNDGSGVYTASASDPFVDVFDSVIAFADVNNNGLQDVLIMGKTTGVTPTANLYVNTGGGIYADGASSPFQAGSGGDVAFADLDGDGDQDLVMTGIDSNTDGFSKLYLNNGSGTFSEDVTVNFEGLRISSVELFDADGDDDVDVLLSGEDTTLSPFTGLYLNNGLADFTLDVSAPFEDCFGGDIAIGDTDGDGDKDVLLSGSTGTGDISQLYLSDGVGGFVLQGGTSFPGNFSGENHFADFDNDGDLDVFIVGISPLGVIAHIYTNNGANSFSLDEELGQAYLSCAGIGDMDGDGDMDVIIGGTSFEFPFRVAKSYRNLFVENNPVDVLGCTRSDACNYNPLATTPDDTCEYGCIGCTDEEAANFSAAHTIDDGSCVYCQSTCQGDFNADGLINATDLLGFLALYGGACE